MLTALSTSDEEFNRVADLVAMEYPDGCVVRVEKVNTITNNYNLEPGDKVREMYHGTKASSVGSIIQSGLKSSYNKVSAFGVGTYFSPTIKLSLLTYTDKSLHGLSYVFLCDVIENKTNGNKSTIYVCPSDDSFKIKYLISFYKKA